MTHPPTLFYSGVCVWTMQDWHKAVFIAILPLSLKNCRLNYVFWNMIQVSRLPPLSFKLCFYLCHRISWKSRSCTKNDSRHPRLNASDILTASVEQFNTRLGKCRCMKNETTMLVLDHSSSVLEPSIKERQGYEADSWIQRSRQLDLRLFHADPMIPLSVPFFIDENLYWLQGCQLPKNYEIEVDSFPRWSLNCTTI